MLVDLDYDPHFFVWFIEIHSIKPKVVWQKFVDFWRAHNIPSTYYLPVQWLVSNPPRPGPRRYRDSIVSAMVGRGARGSLGVMYAAGVPVWINTLWRSQHNQIRPTIRHPHRSLSALSAALSLNANINWPGYTTAEPPPPPVKPRLLDNGTVFKLFDINFVLHTKFYPNRSK